MTSFLFTLFMSFVQYLLTPVQKSNNNTSASEFQVPTADINRIYPILYGTAKIEGSNCTWYGDFYTKKVKVGDGGYMGTGLFEKFHETGQIRHFLGFKLTLGYGNMKLHKIHVDNYLLWENTGETGSFAGYIDKPDVFGDKDSFIGPFHFYDGSQTIEDPYLKEKILENVNNYDLTEIPTWNGLSFFSYESGETGLTKSLRTVKTTVSRTFTPKEFLPFNLDISTIEYNGYPTMNAVFIVYDLLTNSEYGCGKDPSEIDIQSFWDAANIAYNEGWGLSVYIDKSEKARQLIEEVLKYPNFILRRNKETNKFVIKAIRDDYVFENLPQFNKENILEVISYSGGGVDKKLNEVRINYTDFDEFVTNTETFENEGVRYEKSEVSSTTLDYSYINDAGMAAIAAKREAMPLSSELTEIVIDVSFNDGRNLTEGDVFVFNFEPYNVFNKVFRVKKVEFAEAGKFAARIYAMQDVFGLNFTTNSPAPKTSWNETDKSLIGMDLKVIDAPRFFSTDTYKVYCFGEKPKKTIIDYDLYINGKYDSPAFDFTPTATTVNAYSKTHESSFVVLGDDLADFSSFTNNDIDSGVNMMVIDTPDGYEFASFRAVEYDSLNQNWVLTQIQRGAFDTIPKEIPAGSKIYFTYYGSSLNFSTELNVGSAYKFNALTKTSASNVINIEDTEDVFKTITARKDRPICPAGLKINGDYFAETIPLNTDLSLSWFYRNKEDQNKLISFSRDIAQNLESGTSYVLNIYDNQDVLVKTENLTTNSYVFSDETSLNGGNHFPSLRIELYANDGTLDSLEMYNITITRV